jgi:redox-sensitive bicupin YhaK (pirin superfamily)
MWNPPINRFPLRRRKSAASFDFLRPRTPAGAGTSAVIHQDVWVYAAELREGEKLSHPVAAGRFAWVQIARGNMLLNGQGLGEGDGAAIGEERELSFAGHGAAGAEFLLFDLA